MSEPPSPPADLPAFVRLDGPAVTLPALTLIVATAGGVPAIIYWGPALPADLDPQQVVALAARGPAPSSPEVEPILALSPQIGDGWPGRPGFGAHRDGRGWATAARLVEVVATPARLTLLSRDPAHGIELRHEIALEGEVVAVRTRLTNAADTVLTVDHLAAPYLPLPAAATRIIGFDGHWAGEFGRFEVPRSAAAWVRENRRGRTSHDSFPGVIVAAAGTSEAQGLALGAHLGWSGNHRLAVETLPDGRAWLSAEALLLPGEIRLVPGASLTTPWLYAGASDAGMSRLSQHFHRFVRSRRANDAARSGPRKVHCNSWEAVYFDHDPAVLNDLAARAAAVGVERFVLDDGWFRGRRNDRAGLGDWTVDPDVWPQGLGPLIAHVHGLGMDFGLWVEPEMVNPDSDLYRAHPDWVLATPPAAPQLMRHQLALDFGRKEVRAHILAALRALLDQYPIAYLKWDMNRDLSQPGGADGRAAAHAHVEGLYAVLDELRADYPALEIESCASGGGRADYGILARSDRIWTSDSNDALDRLAIQRGVSHFFPAEVMGAHVGPAVCHTTGRRLSMALRVATALFGHMGVELDLRDLDARDTADLAAGIALHKAHRGLIHSGDLVRLDSPRGSNAFLIVAADASEALLSYSCITEPGAVHPAPLTLAGLDPSATYDLAVIWPPRLPPDWPLAAGGRFAGAALIRAGLQPPRLHPGSAVIVHLRRRAAG